MRYSFKDILEVFEGFLMTNRFQAGKDVMILMTPKDAVKMAKEVYGERMFPLPPADLQAEDKSPIDKIVAQNGWAYIRTKSPKDPQKFNIIDLRDALDRVVEE